MARLLAEGGVFRLVRGHGRRSLLSAPGRPVCHRAGRHGKAVEPGLAQPPRYSGLRARTQDPTAAGPGHARRRPCKRTLVLGGGRSSGPVEEETWDGRAWLAWELLGVRDGELGSWAMGIMGGGLVRSWEGGARPLDRQWLGGDPLRSCPPAIPLVPQPTPLKAPASALRTQEPPFAAGTAQRETRSCPIACWGLPPAGQGKPGMLGLRTSDACPPSSPGNQQRPPSGPDPSALLSSVNSSRQRGRPSSPPATRHALDVARARRCL